MMVEICNVRACKRITHSASVAEAAQGQTDHHPNIIHMHWKQCGCPRAQRQTQLD